MGKYLLALDQGTTSTRAILLSKEGRILYQAQRPVTCFFPQPGWVEQDPDQLWISLVDVVNEILILAGVSMADIAAIGLANQRETTIVWDKATGRAIYPAIVWQSQETASLCDRYKPQERFIHNRTGLRVSPYFSASKIRFILEKVPGAEENAKAGQLAFGTVDSWLLYKLTQGKTHATDPSNASRTLLYNIFTNDWDPDLLALFQIPRSMLPKVLDSAGDFGVASFFPGGVHVMGVAGDQQAALYGQCCHEVGESKNTYGTGLFMLMNTGEKPILSKQGILTTIAWRYGGKTIYALEGSVFIGGAVVQWLRDEMGWFKESAQSENYALKKPDTAGVYFVPAFVGLGTPYWDEETRGAIFGLTRGADRHNITRAALNAIAYESRDVIDVMKAEAGLTLPALKVDGGASDNGLLMQFQSDILQCPILVPMNKETTALGAGALAGIGSGFFPDAGAFACTQIPRRRFTPQMDPQEADRLYAGWKEAVAAARHFRPLKGSPKP